MLFYLTLGGAVGYLTGRTVLETFKLAGHIGSKRALQKKPPKRKIEGIAELNAKGKVLRNLNRESLYSPMLRKKLAERRAEIAESNKQWYTKELLCQKLEQLNVNMDTEIKINTR
ncbi:MAG TPA: hypothetical protein GX687_04590 [Clostridia bacterium]|jgi:hypothetical protein|nr:hypothetical protein [Clostridia bacterium]